MTTSFSSPEFLSRLKEKDDAALNEIVRAYTSHLIKAGLGLGLTMINSEEVAQSTWLTFVDIVPRFEGRSHIRTFLFGIFYNKVSEFRRSRIKVEKCDPIEDIVEQSFRDDGHFKQHQMGPEMYSEGIEVMKIIELCLENLPHTQRLVFTMKIVEELETEEICNTLDISDTNLRQLLFRGKNRLKACIDGKMKK